MAKYREPFLQPGQSVKTYDGEIKTADKDRCLDLTAQQASALRMVGYTLEEVIRLG